MARAVTLGAAVEDALAADTIDSPERVAPCELGVVDVPKGGYASSAHSPTLLTFAQE
jgi:hypothetical protein